MSDTDTDFDSTHDGVADFVWTKVDRLYSRARSNVIAPPWAKPYLAVRPTAARRMLNADFRAGRISREEESAVRAFLIALDYADDLGKSYPTWNKFIEELLALEAMSENARDDLWAEGILTVFPKFENEHDAGETN